MVLERFHKGGVLCRVSFGLTLYLPQAPSRDEIMRAYSVYRRHCPPDHRRLVTTARTPLYLPLAADDLDHVYRCLHFQDRRRDDGIVVWDGETVRYWMFWMQGWLDPIRGTDTASFCQIYVPEGTACETLHRLARDLADELPVLSGHGGYTVQFDARLKAEAFDQIYAWAKRYLGVEVEDLNLTLPLVRDAIKGANWLTLVGHELWSKLMSHPDRARELPAGVDYERLHHAGLFRAGAQPVLGDRNRREFPKLYAALEKALQPLKLQHHPEFAGRFGEEQATDAWLYRLLEPAQW